MSNVLHVPRVTDDLSLRFLKQNPAFSSYYELGHVIQSHTLGELPQEELEAGWSETFASGKKIEPVDSRFGNVVNLSDISGSRGLLSVDVCEVLRQTGNGLLSLAGTSVESIYEKGCHYVSALSEQMSGLPPSADVIPPALKGVMNADANTMAEYPIRPTIIEPIEGWGSIREILTYLREQDVAVIANTSTLPQCELATIDYIHNWYKECFDGFLFPGNHHGHAGQLNKGDALDSVMNTKEMSRLKRVAKIDDTPYHVQAVLDKAAQRGITQLAGFVPAYNWNRNFDPTHTTRQGTPLESFERIADFFKQTRERTVV